MGKFYLDEHTGVRFDQTPDHREARAANFYAGVLSMIDLLERQARLVAHIALLRGQPSTLDIALANIESLRRDIRAQRHPGQSAAHSA